MCVVVDKENKVPRSTRTGRGARGTVAPPRPQHHIPFFCFYVTSFIKRDLLTCVGIHLENAVGVSSVNVVCVWFRGEG